MTEVAFEKSKLPCGAAEWKADYLKRAAVARLVAKTNDAAAEAYGMDSEERNQFLGVARIKQTEAERFDRSAAKMQLALELEADGFKPANLGDEAIDAAEARRAESVRELVDAA